MYIGYIDGAANREGPMNDEQNNDEQDKALRDRFNNMGDAFKKHFDITKPGTEPIKDETEKRNRK